MFPNHFWDGLGTKMTKNDDIRKYERDTDMEENNTNQYWQQPGMNGQHAQYGQQPDMNGQYAQYGQQPYPYQRDAVYQQTTDMYGDQSFKPESPKMKKGIKTALIATISVLAVVAACLLVYFLVLKKTPREAVEDALENTSNEVKTSGIAGDIAFDEFDKDNLDIDTGLTIENYDGSDNLSDLQITAGWQNSEENFDVNASMSAGGQTLSYNMKCVDNIIYYTVPELMTKYVMMDEQDIIEDDEDYITTEESLTDYIEDRLEPLNDKLKEAVVYEKAGREEFTNENGDTVKAVRYTVTIPEEAVGDYASDIEDLLNEYVDSVLTDEALEKLGVSRSDIKQSIGAIPSSVGAVVTDDIVIDVYVKGGKAIRIETGYEISAAAMSAELVIDCMGDEQVTSDTKASLVLESADGSVSVDYSYTSDTDGDKTTDNSEAVVSVSGEDYIRYTCTNTYNSSTGDMSTDASVGAESEEIGFSISGKLADVKKGESFRLEDMKLTISNNGEECLALSGWLEAGQGDGDITAPSDTVDYEDFEESDGADYIDAAKLEEILQGWSEILETVGLGYTDYDYLDDNYADDDTDDYLDDYTDDYSQDYSDTSMSFGDRLVEINDVAGYYVSYASDYSVYLASEDNVWYDVTYYSEEGSTIDECSTYYDLSYDSDTEVLEQLEGTAMAPDGTEVTYKAAKRISYDTDIYDAVIYYPAEEGVIVCVIDFWEYEDEDIDINNLINTFIGAIEIK